MEPPTALGLRLCGALIGPIANVIVAAAAGRPLAVAASGFATAMLQSPIVSAVAKTAGFIVVPQGSFLPARTDARHNTDAPTKVLARLRPSYDYFRFRNRWRRYCAAALFAAMMPSSREIFRALASIVASSRAIFCIRRSVVNRRK